MYAFYMMLIIISFSFSQDCSEQAMSVCCEEIVRFSYFTLLSCMKRHGSITQYGILSVVNLACLICLEILFNWIVVISFRHIRVAARMAQEEFSGQLCRRFRSYTA